MKKTLLVAALCAAFGVFPAVASATNHATSQAVSTEQQPLTDGEVRKVDKEAKKLTIRHGPIANLDMPAMTMVFQVQDLAILDSVKAGDKVRFVADKAGGAYIVTRIEPAK